MLLDTCADVCVDVCAGMCADMCADMPVLSDSPLPPDDVHGTDPIVFSDSKSR